MSRLFDGSYPPNDRDPVDARFADFDWNDVFERLGDVDGTVMDSPEHHETISRLMNLLLTDAQGLKISPKALGLRLIALGWVLNPANYPDTPSLRRLAERCGVSPALLAFYTGEVSRLTGIRNRPQRHAANWKPT